MIESDLIEAKKTRNLYMLEINVILIHFFYVLLLIIFYQNIIF